MQDPMIICIIYWSDTRLDDQIYDIMIYSDMLYNQMIRDKLSRECLFICLVIQCSIDQQIPISIEWSYAWFKIIGTIKWSDAWSDDQTIW